MIRVERALKGKNGEYSFWAGGYAVEGLSSQPLLDACRELKRMGVDEAAEIGLFREGSSEWDLKTTVGYGASRTVREDRQGFARYKEKQPFWKDAAE